MRILISANEKPFCLEWEYHRALNSLGHDLVPHYGWDPEAIQERRLHRKAVRRLAPSIYFGPANANILRVAKETRPDFVLIFKGADIFPDTIDRLKSAGIKVIAYNPDHPWDFFSRGSGNRFISRSVDKYDLYITYSRHIQSQLNQRYPLLPTSVIPFGHGIDVSLFSTLSKQVENTAVCFVGNPDPHRASKIKLLAASGICVDVYGHGWNAILGDVTGVHLKGPVVGFEMYQVLRKYRVQLNFLRPHNFNSHNMRSFEIPGAGGIMLAERTSEHIDFFRPGIEAFYFGSDEELIEQSKMLLSKTAAAADRIRYNARRRCESERYSYLSRAQQILTAIQTTLFTR